MLLLLPLLLPPRHLSIRQKLKALFSRAVRDGKSCSQNFHFITFCRAKLFPELTQLQHQQKQQQVLFEHKQSFPHPHFWENGWENGGS